MRIRRRQIWLSVLVLSCGVIAFALIVNRVTRELFWVPPTPPSAVEQAIEPLPPPPLTTLRETDVVPTLDSPLTDEGRSAIWCASFQLAWDRLKHDVVRGPVQIRGTDEAVRRLNESELPKNLLRPDDYLALAGAADDGIVERIRREMTQRFPGAPVPELNLPPQGYCAFGYLAAHVAWRHEYFDSTGPMTFTDFTKRSTAIRTFGIRDEEHNLDVEGRSFRGQPALLWDAPGTKGAADEFAIDLCRFSKAYQVVLARVTRKATLAATLSDLNEKMERHRGKKDQLGYEDTMLVPAMHWRIQHRFKELEGKVVTNGPAAGMPVIAAVQEIQFLLDRRGAHLRSGSFLPIANGGPRRFHFDGPFLLYMKERAADRPFFVMWVANAELLQPY